MFLPVQIAAAKAMELDASWHSEVNSIYKERKEIACELLDLLHCTYSKNQVGMFVWAKIPNTYKTGFELSDAVLYKANVFITPGGIFGNAGDGFVRISLCSKKEVLLQAIERIKNKLGFA
jgi:aspartate/methionine/tyrosine aminotransferase